MIPTQREIDGKGPDEDINGLQNKDQKRRGKFYNPRGHILPNIDMVNGFILNNRPNLSDVVLGLATGFVKVKSMFEAFFTSKASNSINSIIIGRKGNGESRFTNLIELSANADRDIENLEQGYTNGLVKLRGTRDGSNPSQDRSGITVGDVHGFVAEDRPEGTINHIIGQGKYGGITMAHITNKEDVPSEASVKMVMTEDGTAFSGTVTGASDERIKKDIRDIQYGLDAIKKLRSVVYKYKEGKNQNDQLGFIAQEVRGVMPELVVEDKEGMLSIAYDGIIPALVKAVQELSEKVDKLAK